jgi:outer membrane protein OmpA-like peptidoglycan-associated protein
MVELQKQKNKITDVAKNYSKFQEELNKELTKEFKLDLKKWRASIEDDNTIRFYGPEVLFQQGSSEIRPNFQNILKDFFPRYIKILTNKQYKNDIEEIRIEGHTSSEWETANSFQSRYLANLSLSQARSFEVLKYCLLILDNQNDREWLKGVFMANGLSFAKPLKRHDGSEDKEKSRRVEFKVIAKTRQRIEKILELSDGK